MTTVSPYTETLGHALAAIKDELVNRGVILSEGCADWLDVFTFGGLAYGTSKEAHAAIFTIKDKPTKKWAHATIWRHETGRYEWNLYVL